LKRQFEADAPNQKWVTDVTEFSVGDRKLYLSPVMDLFYRQIISYFYRQIISYAIGPSPNLELTNSSLRGALATLEDGQKPLVHSDQGFQYQHTSWRVLLQNAGGPIDVPQNELLRQRRHGEFLLAPQRRALQPRPIPQHRSTDSSAARIHPLVQHRKSLHEKA